MPMERSRPRLMPFTLASSAHPAWEQRGVKITMSQAPEARIEPTSADVGNG